MNPYTYGTMFNDLQSWNEDYSSDLQAALPRLIQDGELRALRDLDLDNLDYSQPTTAVNTLTGLVSKPTSLIRDRVVFLVSAAGVPIATLVKKSADFVTEYNISWQQSNYAAAQPKYYAEYSPTQWVVGPPPSQAYTLNVRGIYPSALLGDNDEDTSPAAVAALQHTTASTPLTLTATPYVPETAIQLSLTSSANMSANNFTVVGLDSDGDALTVVIAGPNAGTVTTSEFFSSITSITPSATDMVNEVSAGDLQDTTSWLSVRFPDLLFSACMIEVTGYLKRFSAQAVSKNDYNEKLEDVLQETRNLQRSDLDDLFATRQLVNGPPKQAVMPPTSQVAQTPAPGSQ